MSSSTTSSSCDASRRPPSPPLDGRHLALPEASSERRDYIPIGFLSPDKIASNRMCVLPHATHDHFGVLTSSVHMAWMRVVAGRLETRYCYSPAVVYNNFPWPESGEESEDRGGHAEAGRREGLQGREGLEGRAAEEERRSNRHSTIQLFDNSNLQ